jgi:malate dehydrogenase (oxaloacetate-decarboxylating)(NADP+)
VLHPCFIFLILYNKQTNKHANMLSCQLADQRFLFHGAGSAGVGVADLLSSAIVAESRGAISMEEARTRIWLVDSQGLVTSERDMTSLQRHKIPYAHSLPVMMSPLQKDDSQSHLEHAVEVIKPTALLGMSAQAGAFTRTICQRMAAFNQKPIIFALSNPTDKSECSAADAYSWTDGKCIFASG